MKTRYGRLEIQKKLLSRIGVGVKNECWPWLGFIDLTGLGYGKLTIAGGNWWAHRAVYHYFIGPIPKGKIIRHSCDVPRCCNPKHLILGTQRDNILDQIKKGRNCRGEMSHFSKLNENKVTAIRILWKSEFFSQSQIASMFGVKQQTILKIVNRHKWRHLL
jgi:hypothetical protein